MELLLYGNILLVGEGDFSYAVSVVEKLPSNKYDGILATSLETQQSIQKHQYAAKNISLLEQKGVTVRLETDATQLHVDPFTSSERFDCIIFNFPHAGGKSNHKKNRKLLNDFFASGVQVLKKHGQILMTLCKGQGGTPADRPMRAWHDSWQVVSMAANSGLILTKVLPFRAEDYMVYTSTGFRSLDKGFHTENALTHVFEVAEPVCIPSSTEKLNVRVGTHLLSCPPYIYRKLKQIRCINSNMDHPVHRVYDRIIQNLKTTVSNLKVDNLGIQAPINHVAKSASAFESAEVLSTCCFHSQLEKSDSSDLNESDDLSDLVSERMLKEVTGHNEEFSFISDPLIFKSEIGEKIQALYVPVYKPCAISVNQSVISYNISIAWPIVIDQNVVKDLKSFQEFLTTAINETTENFTAVLNSMIAKSEYSAGTVSLKNSETLLGDSMRSSHTSDIIIYNSDHQSSSDGMVQENKESVKIGSCHCKVIGDLTCPSQAVLYLTADLCKLACCRYNIEDWRLLWSDELRILEQFAELECEKLPVKQGFQNNVAKSEEDAGMSACCIQLETPVIRSPSLYPMTFVHDMSFWENQSVPFDEIEYCKIIRDVTDESVINVELIDTYIDPVAGQCSRCYRLTFQSVDQALSYNTSWRLQSLIRLEVEKKMKIVLR